jgi:hypothetical protein
MKQMRRSGLSVVGLCLGLAVLTVLAMPVAADGPNRVALVVAHENGVRTKCIEFEGDGITGLDVLRESGLDLIYEGQSQGAFICRIDNVGCDFPQEACDCEFHAPDYRFWKYYKLENGEWKFYSVGASTARVEDGDVEGWIFAGGNAAGGGAEPELYSFTDICSSASPTATPDSSDDDADDEELPTIDYFKADRTTVAAGEAVQLSWDLWDAKEAYLEVDGSQQGVIAPYVLTVNPTKTTTYRLIAKNSDGEVDEEITITVSGTAAPSPTFTVPAVMTLPATATPLPPTATPASEVAAAAAPPPTDTPLPPMEWPTPAPETTAPPPTLTPTPSGPPTPTWTPVPLDALSPTPAAVAMAGGSDAGGAASSGSGAGDLLLRASSGSGGRDMPVMVLALVGGVAVVGGLGSLLLLVSASRR